MPIFSKGRNSKIINGHPFKTIKTIKLINCIIISNQLTKFQVPSLNSFEDILLESLKCQHFQRRITPKIMKRIHSKVNR